MTCRCGHAHEAHRHHRPGADCGACGRDFCARYTPPWRSAVATWWRSLPERVHGWLR